MVLPIPATGHRRARGKTWTNRKGGMREQHHSTDRSPRRAQFAYMFPGSGTTWPTSRKTKIGPNIAVIAALWPWAGWGPGACMGVCRVSDKREVRPGFARRRTKHERLSSPARPCPFCSVRCPLEALASRARRCSIWRNKAWTACTHPNSSRQPGGHNSSRSSSSG